MNLVIYRKLNNQKYQWAQYAVFEATNASKEWYSETRKTRPMHVKWAATHLLTSRFDPKPTREPENKNTKQIFIQWRMMIDLRNIYIEW